MKKKVGTLLLNSRLLTILAIVVLVTIFDYTKSFDQGINTVDEKNKGNWYEKLNWWRKSKPKYEALVKVVNTINNMKKNLEDKHNKITTKFNNFIKSLNLNTKLFVKNIDDKIIQVNRSLEKEYLEDEQELLKTTNNLKNTLLKLKLDFQALMSIKNNLDISISNNLASQCAQAENYEETALHNFEEIENVLDDKKARNLYEIIENANENVLAIKVYISGSLENYISESTIKLDQLQSEIEKTVKDLESKDIYLRELTKEEIQAKEEEKIREEKAALEKKKMQEAQKKAQECQEVQLSWYDKIILVFKNLINKIRCFFMSLFFKSDK